MSATLFVGEVVACTRCGRVGHCAQRDSIAPDEPAGRNCRIAIGQQAGELSPPAYKVKPPVAVADAGDHCAECHRLLVMTEALYETTSGRLICKRCATGETAVVDGKPVTAAPRGNLTGVVDGHRFDVSTNAVAHELPTWPPSNLPTSELIRRAASYIEVPGAPPYVASVVAEMRARAALLEAEAFRYLDGDDEGARGDVLRAIGQVRS